MRIQVKDIMSSPVVTAIGESSVEEVRAMMKEKGIHAIPIVSHTTDTVDTNMTIRGIVTATDINKEVDKDAIMDNILTGSSVHVVHTSSSVQAAANMMLKNKVHHMVVMDEGKIEGMISALDFVKLVAEHPLG